MKIGIIGYGFVGRAVASAYHEDEVMYNDPAVDGSSIDDIKQQCETIFICVPTPQGNNGECDISILVETLDLLQGFDGLVICKSTASPLLYRQLEADYADLKLVHAPEFLTAANAVRDYLKPVKLVIGCKEHLHDAALRAIYTERIRVNITDCEFCSIEEAAMFKYVANSFLAMKVVINNEYEALCAAQGIDYTKVAAIAARDPRLGDTHWAVPGPDGKRGFGGACFPKDTAALLNIAASAGVDLSMLNNAVTRNQSLRQ